MNLSTGRATIVWRSPPYDGGRTVIGYTVEAKHAGESPWTVIAESCHSLSYTILSAETNSVTPGESYRFRVRAENIHGLSNPSMESDPIRIPKQGETMLQEEDEGNNLFLKIQFTILYYTDLYLKNLKKYFKRFVVKILLIN